MRKNKYIMVDLLLLSLTIAMMILLNAVFYPIDKNDASAKTESVSNKAKKGQWLWDVDNDLNKNKSGGKDSLNTDLIMKEAISYKDHGNLDSALAMCDKALVIDSMNVKGYYLRAIINTLLKRNTDAIRDYSKTLKLNPEYLQAFLNRGLLCMKEKQILNAFFDFIYAIKLNPIKSASFLLTHSLQSWRPFGTKQK
jgi:tetratricopeptide (TPR) repeat protein